jgi:hypothetical protein
MAPAPGVSNDPRGVLDTPKTGIASIDQQVQKSQAEDERHLADLRRQSEQAKR